jgi:DNA-binding NarL/FixJ family response regulator
VTSVLLVDDDPDLRLLLRYSLSDEGFDIVGDAANGQDGVEQARCLQPDLIILDLVMPVLDGLTALPQLAEVAPDSAVVVLSVETDAEMRGRALTLGAQAFISKPTTTQHLAGVLAVVAAA